MEIIDISLDIKSNMILFPDDPKFKLTRILDMTSKGDLINLSKFEIGAHTGSHVDCPLHFISNGKTVSDFHLTKFYGNCKVIDLTSLNYGETIDRAHLINITGISDQIILFKTQNSFLHKEKYREDHIALSISGASFLVENEVKAIGIDYLSIGDLRTHKLLLSNDIVVFEGLDLTSVNSGNYIFIGFPIKIINIEASPVRAVLLKE